MKILIIGYGSIAKKHVVALKKINQAFEIFALRTSEDAENEPGITNVFTYQAAEELDVTFVIISNPTASHFATISHIKTWNKPLFIEKPIFNSLIGAEGIRKYLTHNNIFNYTACNLRFLDCLVFIKNYLKDKVSRINEVNIYSGSYLPDWRPDSDYKKSYSANENMGGGVHLDLIHEIDYVYWMFGKPLENYKVHSSNSSIGINSIDYSNNIFLYKNFSCSIILNYYRRVPKREFEVLLENDIIKIDLLQNRIVNSKGDILFESKQSIVDTYLEQMKYFITNFHLKPNRSINDINDAIEVLKLCLDD